MESSNQSVVGKFLIHDSTKILNRGFFLIGELIDGKIETGNIILLDFNGFVKNIEIEQIEEVIKLKNGIPLNWIAIKISTEIAEIFIDQIKENNEEVIAKIFKK